MKSTKFAYVAGFMLAMAFTFACSGGEDDTDGSYSSRGGSSSSANVIVLCDTTDFVPERCPDAVTVDNTVSCGGQTYRTVQIGDQVWMAENLNYNTTNSKCYGEGQVNWEYGEDGHLFKVPKYTPAEIQAHCDTYGRLYEWVTAMAMPSPFCPKEKKHRGVCPDGWHIPSSAEWTTLINHAGGDSIAGTKLKATSGWKESRWAPTGTDDYGFTALPGGEKNNSAYHEFDFIDGYGEWWSSSYYGQMTAIGYIIFYDREVVWEYDEGMIHYWYGVRCIQD